MRIILTVAELKEYEAWDDYQAMVPGDAKISPETPDETEIELTEDQVTELGIL